MKWASDRWNETIQYLNTNFQWAVPLLGDHINSLVLPGRRNSVSRELSLGSRSDEKDDPQYAANTSKRHALRALLLCQRIYYSEQFWAKQSEAGPGLHVIPMPGLLPNGWKTTSLNFWSGKTEHQIKEGIAMFATVPGASRGDLAAAAHAGAPNGVSLPGNLTLSRSDHDTIGAGIICYVGVQGWLVKSGIVSMRWFMRNCSPNKQAGCDLIFGQGNTVWNAAVKPEDQQKLQGVINRIGAGYVVHIWSPQNYNWNGHWVITNGDGTICGVNNGEVEAHDGRLPVLKNYTNHSTLFEQFEDYGGHGAGGWRTGVMAVIDPMTMPGRM